MLTITGSDLIQMGILIALIVTPLGAMIQHNRNRNAESRRVIFDKLDELHRCLEDFRAETSRELGAFDARLSTIEGRSFRVRATDRGPQQ